MLDGEGIPALRDPARETMREFLVFGADELRSLPFEEESNSAEGELWASLSMELLSPRPGPRRDIGEVFIDKCLALDGWEGEP